MLCRPLYQMCVCACVWPGVCVNACITIRMYYRYTKVEKCFTNQNMLNTVNTKSYSILHFSLQNFFSR